ncbi:MAG: hypothetical protein RLP09_03675 [Sandaracinaceae bacterium]
MRLLAAMKTDAVLQQRNQLYAISVGVSLVVAGALAWLSPNVLVARTVPMALLLFVGGSTLLYVVAMILLERDDGTLAAVIVSPLRPGEYLASKALTLGALATVEGVLIAAGALLVLSREGPVTWPDPLLFLAGLAALSVMHVLVGVIVVVRHRRIMEALIPMGAIAMVLQLPAFYFVGALDHPAWLLVPSAAPTMLIRGAFTPLTPWELTYGVGVTTLCCVGLAVWARRAFHRHVVLEAS